MASITAHSGLFWDATTGTNVAADLQSTLTDTEAAGAAATAAALSATSSASAATAAANAAVATAASATSSLNSAVTTATATLNATVAATTSSINSAVSTATSASAASATAAATSATAAATSATAAAASATSAASGALTNATVSGTMTINGAGTALVVTNNARVSGILSTTGAATIGGNLTASSPIFATSAGTGLAVTNNATVGGTLVVSGQVTVPGLVSSRFLSASGGGTVTLSGASGPAAGTSPLFVQASAAGTTTNTQYSINNILMPSDAVAASGVVDCFSVQHNWGGSTATGNRIGTYIVLNQTAKSGNLAAARATSAGSALTTLAQVGINEGGTSGVGNGYGNIFGINPIAVLLTGATFFQGCVGAEINFGGQTGASTERKVGLQIVQRGDDAVAASAVDSLLVIGSQTGASVGTQNGLMVGDPTSQWPLASSGTIIGAYMGQNNATKPANAKWGLDLQHPVFPATGNAFDGGALRSNGIAIDGAGVIQQGSCYTSSSSTGHAIDLKGAIGNTANGAGAVAAGGSGWLTNHLATDPYGGIYVVSATAGAVTSVTVYRQPTFNSTTTPANPVTLTPVLPAIGTGLTLNLSWNTTDTTLALYPSGGAVTLGGILNLKGFTVSTLPPAATAGVGAMAYVTDATAPTYNGALTGGGAVKIPVFSNGTSWTAH